MDFKKIYRRGTMRDNPHMEELIFEDFKMNIPLFQSGEFILMQSTGLKDTNKKLIYEGDIVEKWEKGKRYRYIIIYDDTGTGFFKEDISSGFQDGLHEEPLKKYYKIIGNIYENPELLKNE
jgi:uncharacterized phage protein (TIGR01671 family)